jgi:putative hemolysin
MILGEVLIILVLILGNAFFAGAEIAIVSLRMTRLQELADHGNGGARAAIALRAQPERFLATVQIGITVVSATAAAFGGASMAEHLEPLLARGPWLTKHAEGLALGLVIVAISFLSIVVGELVPKSLALRAAEHYGLLVARPLLVLSMIARPLVWLLSSCANLLLKPFGDETTFMESQHSSEELQQLVGQAKDAGSIHPDAAEIATRALKLPTLTVEEVMIPRGEVVAISDKSSAENLQRILLEHTHSRMPVYSDTIDNVVGYISVKDLLALAWEQRLVVLKDVIRPAFFVPETKKAVELLREMRARHVPFAVVVDEHGGMAGVVTMEDVLGELVGEIFSEHDAGSELVSHEAEGWAVVDASASIREVNRRLSIALPDDGAWSTLAGLVLALAGRMPAVGQTFRLPDGVELVVADASPRRINAVRVRSPIEPPTEAGEAGENQRR